MQKRILYTRPDGGVSVVVPADTARGNVLRADAVTRYLLLLGGTSDQPLIHAVAVLAAPDVTDVMVGNEDRPLVGTLPEGAELVGYINHPSSFRPESDEEFMDRILQKDVPAGTADVTVCDCTEVPDDRTFRDAWKPGVGGVVSVDMASARTIHLERIRAARDRQLQALDGPELRAQSMEDAPALSEVREQKQVLRDIPETYQSQLAAAADPAALAAIWPAELSQ